MTEIISTGARIEFDGIDAVSDFGEFAKLAMKLRMDADITWAVNEYDDTKGAYRLILERFPDQRERLDDEVCNLFILWCVAKGMSGSEGLQLLEQRARNRHLPMDQPIQDVMSIGGGPDHDGHDH